MGMFDSVNFKCPYCKSLIEKQSKAGKCDLKKYKSKSVPAEIASDIKGDFILCLSCGSAFKIVGKIPRVSLELKDRINDYESD